MLSARDLYSWCRVPAGELAAHPQRKIPFRLCRDSATMGRLMADELATAIAAANRERRAFRAIIPCGPACWYRPFAERVNRDRIRLDRFEVFHMDECLDWQGRELPRAHPYSFRGAMERDFYNPIEPDLQVPEPLRHWVAPQTIDAVRAAIESAPIDLTYGGWGQDGHIAYNQTRRHPYSQIGIDELRQATVRIQDNNLDTMIALAHRTFGGAWQFVPPMSVTLGIRECLSARRVRLFSDTGAWKQTALRVALFGPVTTEYPMTLLQDHPDALLTATEETAAHPISLHPEWDLGLPCDRA